ncbi:MAG: flagellar assembly protein FliX [Pseudolabrys sp.]|nr:flagellar assembly protein FliX [Pseudolabrys sp.]MBV9261338.1 flagellar assembly protein FliX [Pseudolabrys sp.]
MRVYGTNGAARATSPANPRRTAAPGGFSVSEGDAPRETPSTGALRSVSSVDALIALQGVGDATERRKRAVKQGRAALDALDSLKVGVLSGDVDPTMLGRLKAAAESIKGGSGDSGLDVVLGEIELRLEVELAKAGVH